MENKYESRWGKFHLDSIHFDTVCGDPCGEHFKQLVSLTSQILIVKAEQCPFKKQIDYTGISPLFEVLEECETIPEYELEGQMIENEDGSYKYEVKAFRRSPRCSYCGHSYKNEGK